MMAITWEAIDESTRIAAQPGTVGFIMAGWDSAFTFRQFDSRNPAFPRTLMAYRSGTNEKAVVSYRRAITLVEWGNEHLGEGRVAMTPEDLFSFQSDTDMVMFATFWNGVEVPLCSIDKMPR